MVTRAATLAERLREIPPADRVIDDPATLLPYAYDASFWSLRQQRVPDVVVVPRSTAEVQGVVRFADATGTAVVPRGAGTGQTGGAVAARGGIVISFARMREIIEIDRRNLQVVVEPGIVFSDLQDALRPHGLFFPPDPGSGRACTLGGMAANNASGPHAVRWGTTSAYVLGAEVVLADGSVITTGGVHSKALKSSSGIDLTKLFVGSEGTLGIFTRLRIRVQPRPPARTSPCRCRRSLRRCGARERWARSSGSRSSSTDTSATATCTRRSWSIPTIPMKSDARTSSRIGCTSSRSRSTAR